MTTSEFHPDASMKTIYLIYLALIVLAGFASWLIPISVYVFWVEPTYAWIISLPLAALVAALLFTVYWIYRFYASITYRLTDREVVVTQGVWFRNKRFVPYNRITNVETTQGPISRRYGVGKVAIQTAGYSRTPSAGGRAAEAEVEFVKNFEELRDSVISFLGKTHPVAVEAGETPPSEGAVESKILDELKKIRRTLEKQGSGKGER
jgi:membrane protein YdbS with pleckstrin-like domain